MHLLAQHLLRFFLPWACCGCRDALAGLEDHGFCGRCWLSVPRIQGLICLACGIPLKDGGERCYGCRTAPPPLIIRAATEYRGVIPAAIYRFKYADVQGMIPVPLYRRNEKARGYNQAELLAGGLSRHTGLAMVPLLVRTRNTRSQYRLNREERHDNVRSAFEIHPFAAKRMEAIKGSSFLLIDDICTTASTLEECAKALRRAGVKSVKALVLARDL